MSHCYPSKRVTARKAVPCTWCAETIVPGEPYERQGTINEDGVFWTNKMHPECWDVACRECFDDGSGYSPYENERPEAAAKPTEPTLPTQGEQSHD